MKNRLKKRLANKKDIQSRHNRQKFGVVFLMTVAFIFLIFVCRFSYIAIKGKIKDVNLRKIAEERYIQASIVKAKRGSIYDATGGTIAEDANSYTVYAILDKNYVSDSGKPLYVTDKKRVANDLSNVLDESYSTIMKYLTPSNKNIYQVEFGSAGRNLSLSQKEKIDSYKLNGIYFLKTPSRLYPNGMFASHEVGLAQVENKNSVNSKLTGIMGIEEYFNKQLSGKNGYVENLKDNFGYNISSPIKKIKAKNGDNVYLTLDPQLELYTESLANKAQSIADPKQMNIVVMDAKTGQILSVAQRPSFNSMTRKGLNKMWRNTLVDAPFEPGSVMKILTLSAAINSNNYHPNELYNSGHIKVGNTIINDWQRGGWGMIPLSQAFPRSSNVGMVHIEQDMGAKTWLNYMHKFGIGKKTGICLPDEQTGSIRFKDPVDQAVTSFGQGVDVTIVQMLQAVSAVTNNGYMLKPQIVSKIVNPNNNKVIIYKPKVVGHPITSHTAKQVLNAMAGVVNDSYGTGRYYKIPGYQVGVKTGTAQIANPKGGGYLKGDHNFIFSVLGAAPLNNPRYIVYVTMKQPKYFYQGDASCIKNLGLIFNPLMKYLLSTTSNNKSLGKVKMPDVVNKSVSSSKKELSNDGFNVVLIGDGNKIVKQNPNSGEILLKNQRVILLTNGRETMPNVSGWSKEDIINLGKLINVNFHIKGNGYVYSQSLKPGSLINKNASINISLKENS